VQCPRCQHENPAQAKFCLECGARLALRCAQCGTELPASAKFCSECGQPAGAAAAPPPPPASPFPSPESYTPHHLAQRILTSRGALEGERKQVTVLFADLRGSTELIQGLDPEEARALLDPALHAMMDAVHRYEGTVNQVLGDGIMALFGAPLAHEDHALRACYAALALQETLGAYGEQVRRSHGVELQARVGLNSGEVVVRAIGNDLHMDYTAVGETTHLAARMEQLALPGTIRLAAATLRLVEGLVRVRSLGPMPVKGLADPVEVFELQGAAPTRTRLQAAAARGLTRFVGRDAELETLRRTLEQAAAGHGQVVAVVGEPGVGKSRLVWEFSHSHRTEGWLVLGAGSVSYGKATSYLPVIDLLKSYCAVEPADDHRRVREKVLGKLLALDRALEPTLPAFLALLDVPVDDPAWQALDPPQRRQRTLDALKRLLLRESQERPVLLVFEDLHWIDAETQALLDSLVESLPTARLLLLVNYRPEYEHGWGRRTYYQQLRLDPLPAASADELLHALLGDDAGLHALKRLLVERTEGNPFFLEESVQALVETGVLAGERGAYRLARPLEHAQVPATVQAVLTARIDRLAPEDKRLLQSAAVIGKDVPYALLAAIAELPEDALRAGVARLQAAEFLYEAALFPELEHTFKHALTHEVAYGSLLGERRRALHARIMEAIERLYPDRLIEYVERLAHHALRGEVWAQAVSYSRQAGAKSAARSAYREAASHVDQAIMTLDHLPDDAGTRELAIDLRLELYMSVMPLGERERTNNLCRELEALAETLGDPGRLARVYALIMARDGVRVIMSAPWNSLSVHSVWLQPLRTRQPRLASHITWE
jgi:class 3 adenylate cyclase